MAAKLLRELLRRQQGNELGGPYGDNGNDPDDDGGDDGYSWWWTPTGLAVRYTIVVAIFALLLLYFVGGYWHARRRLRKGLPLMGYHRWMVARRPPYARQQYYTAAPDYGREPYYSSSGMPPQPQSEAYPMYGQYRPPPPAYNGADAPPPVYQPPQGASKVLADQSYHAVPLAAADLDASPAQGSSSSSSVLAPEAAAASGSSAGPLRESPAHQRVRE